MHIWERLARRCTTVSARYWRTYNSRSLDSRRWADGCSISHPAPHQRADYARSQKNLSAPKVPRRYLLLEVWGLISWQGQQRPRLSQYAFNMALTKSISGGQLLALRVLHIVTIKLLSWATFHTKCQIALGAGDDVALRECPIPSKLHPVQLGPPFHPVSRNRVTVSQHVTALFWIRESETPWSTALHRHFYLAGCQHFIHGFIVPLVWIKGFQDLVQPILKKRRPPQRLKVCTRITWILWDGLVVGSTWFNPQQAPSPSLYHIVTFSFEILSLLNFSKLWPQFLQICIEYALNGTCKYGPNMWAPGGRQKMWYGALPYL